MNKREDKVYMDDELYYFEKSQPLEEWYINRRDTVFEYMLERRNTNIQNCRSGILEYVASNNSNPLQGYYLLRPEMRDIVMCFVGRVKDEEDYYENDYVFELYWDPINHYTILYDLTQNKFSSRIIDREGDDNYMSMYELLKPHFTNVPIYDKTMTYTISSDSSNMDI
jgi:hypothetical protein